MYNAMVDTLIDRLTAVDCVHNNCMSNAAVAGLSVAIVLIIAFTIGLAVLCVGLVFIRR